MICASQRMLLRCRNEAGRNGRKSLMSQGVKKCEQNSDCNQWTGETTYKPTERQNQEVLILSDLAVNRAFCLLSTFRFVSMLKWRPGRKGLGVSALREAQLVDRVQRQFRQTCEDLRPIR